MYRESTPDHAGEVPGGAAAGVKKPRKGLNPDPTRTHPAAALVSIPDLTSRFRNGGPPNQKVAVLLSGAPLGERP